MNTVELARLARQYMPEVRRAATASREPVKMMVAAVRGVAAMSNAILKGDYSSQEEATARRRVCESCPARQASVSSGEDAVWCGPPLTKVEGDEPSCGCLLPLKVLVRGEECPRKKW